MENQLLCYMRKPIDNVLYDPKLAFSMHLALLTENNTYVGLNHNSGVLFASATENEDGSLNPMSLKSPYIFKRRDGNSYGVMAIRIEGDGDVDESSKGSIIWWITRDFVKYQEMGLIQLCDEYLEEVTCEYDNSADNYIIDFLDINGRAYELRAMELISGIFQEFGQQCVGNVKEIDAVNGTLPELAKARWDITSREWFDMEGALVCNQVAITDEMAEYLKCKLTTAYNVSIEFPEKVEASSKEELEKIKAIAHYSDGTIAEKKIDWDYTDISFRKPGEYRIHGTVHQDHFEFPVAFNRADPCVTYWNGKYYFIATNDADENHSLYVREAKSLVELAEAEEKLILDTDMHAGIGGLLWAPEFHEINGRLFIFLAATPGEFYYEESHIMALRKNGNPARKEDWSKPKRMVKMDGNFLCEAGKTITLDMTCFQWQEEWYVIWSQREFLPKDLGAWLYIAKLNEDEPWKLDSEPVVLSKPDYGWGNNHTFVEEGPFALVSNDKLYVTFSAAAVDTSYVVGFLSIEPGLDLLDPCNWYKNNYPILTSRSVEGEFGTGHNAYVTDEDGVIWNTYHARPGTEGVRSSGIRRVHFDIDGDPVLDMTEELDVAEDLKKVSATLVIS